MADTPNVEDEISRRTLGRLDAITRRSMADTERYILHGDPKAATPLGVLNGPTTSASGPGPAVTSESLYESMERIRRLTIAPPPIRYEPFGSSPMEAAAESLRTADLMRDAVMNLMSIPPHLTGVGDRQPSFITIDDAHIPTPEEVERMCGAWERQNIGLGNAAIAFRSGATRADIVDEIISLPNDLGADESPATSSGSSFDRMLAAVRDAEAASEAGELRRLRAAVANMEEMAALVTDILSRDDLPTRLAVAVFDRADDAVWPMIDAIFEERDRPAKLVGRFEGGGGI